MCGIAGIVESGLPPDKLRSCLDRMRDVMERRGPDDARTEVFADCQSGLAARRLSILDLERGAQPIPNEDRTAFAVLNGEIYNHASLREKLEKKGHRFRTRCDTEVLVHLYEEHGAGFLDQLHGMFALAVYDLRERRLLIARDGPGMKPLYHARTPHGFVFASEIKALFASGLLQPEPDLEAVDVALGTGLVPAPMSGFRGVTKLPAGCYCVTDPARSREGRFWRYRYDHRRPRRSASQYAEILEERLRAAVKSHMAADVPVGAFISGGLDSSLVAAIAARHSSSRLTTCAIVFPEEPAVDESRYANLLAKHIGSEHTEVEFRNAEIPELITSAVRHMEEPLCTSPSMVSWKLFREAGPMKVALSGEGADEIFAGYPELRWKVHYRLRRFMPRSLARFLGRRALTPRWKRIWRIVAAPDPHAADLEWRRHVTPEWKQRLLLPSCSTRGPDIEALRLDPESLTNSHGLLERRLQFEYRRRLGDGLLVTSEKLSMAHALELRMPFLDRAVVDFALALPPKMKYRGAREKYVLSLLASRYLPRELAQRRKYGLRNPPKGTGQALRSFAREYLLDDADTTPFDRGELEQFVSQWEASENMASILLPILQLRCWWREFFGSASSVARAGP